MQHNVAEKIKSIDAKAAHSALLEGMPGLGLKMSFKSGVVAAVKLHDNYHRYLFAWIPAQAHLLFYIRRPALAEAIHLHQSVLKLGLTVQRNTAGETTIRLVNLKDAETLLTWLSENLPLPAPLKQ